MHCNIYDGHVMPAEITEYIKTTAQQLGFSGCFFTKPTIDNETIEHYDAFIANGYHGQMEWLAAKREFRTNPQNLLENAQTMVMLAVDYTPPNDPLGLLGNNGKSLMASYALGQDYHDIIKNQCKSLLRQIIEKYPHVDGRVYVDTAPIMEKPLAMQAGMGWQGKNTHLVSRQLGSYFFIASLIINAECDYTPPEKNHCGSCRACLDICPTNAFVAPGQMDARRCISYLTIEYKGIIPREFHKAMQNRIYGCDDCIAICPWNKFAGQSQEMGRAITTHPEWQSEDLWDLIHLTEAEFAQKYRKSPIKRIGWGRFIRNIIIAIGNAPHAKYIPIITQLSTHPDPTIRQHAQWTLEILGDIMVQLAGE